MGYAVLIAAFIYVFGISMKNVVIWNYFGKDLRHLKKNHLWILGDLSTSKLQNSNLIIPPPPSQDRYILNKNLCLVKS